MEWIKLIGLTDIHNLSDIINYLTDNPILAFFVAVCLLTFVVRLPYMCKAKCIRYNYTANTSFDRLDHDYRFTIKLLQDGYRCYIDRTPPFRGIDIPRIRPLYRVEQGTRRCYIRWSRINTPEEARNLCRKWSDATQYLIDTGTAA